MTTMKTAIDLAREAGFLTGTIGPLSLPFVTGVCSNNILAEVSKLLALHKEQILRELAGVNVELVKEDSDESNAAITAMLAEYNYPANPQNAGRAGWRACRLHTLDALVANAIQNQVLQDRVTELERDADRLTHMKNSSGKEWVEEYYPAFFVGRLDEAVDANAARTQE